MPSFAMSGGGGGSGGGQPGNQHGGASMSPMSSLSTGVAASSNPSPSGMSPMGMTVGMTVGPSPGPACLQQRDNGYSCAVGVGRAAAGGYEALHLGYGTRPSCSPTQPYHTAAAAAAAAAGLNQYNHHHHHQNHHHPASSTGECLPHSLHSLLAL